MESLMLRRSALRVTLKLLVRLSQDVVLREDGQVMQCQCTMERYKRHKNMIEPEGCLQRDDFHNLIDIDSTVDETT